MSRSTSNIVRLLLLLELVAWLSQKVSGRIEGDNQQPSILRSLWEYDQLVLHNDTTVQRQGNVNAVQSENGVDTDIGICHLATLLPLSTKPPGDGRRIPFNLGTLEGVAAILLALQHLNTGNGTIIPQVDGLSDRCPIRFTTELWDSQLDERVAMDHVINIVERDGNDSYHRHAPCAFLGAYRSAVSMPTSIITGLKGYPQFTALSTSAQLDDPSQFPLLGRFNPSDDGTALAAILYLQKLEVNHLAVVHTNDAYGNAYVDGLVQAAVRYAPDMVIRSVDIPFNLPLDLVPRIVQSLKDTGFRYFFGIIFDSVHFDPIMEEAYRQGIAGSEEHTWIFSDGVGVNRIVQRRYSTYSALRWATRGMGMITAVGGIPGTSEPFDKLGQALQSLDNQLELQYLKSKMPRYEGEEDVDLIGMLTDFLAGPGLFAPFLYDTAIALGLAACDVVNQDDLSITGKEHFAQTLKTSFDGTSGKIVLNPTTGTREATSAKFVMTNFVEESVLDGVVQIKAVSTDVFTDGEWTQLKPYFFHDGSAVPPPDLPPLVVDQHHIATAARMLIMFMGVSSVSLSIGFALWTKRNRHVRVVKAFQPIFLYIISLGTALMGSSILTLAVDDEIFDSRGCKFACRAFPWFLSLGFVIASSALFTKTHRVNVILNQRQFRRIKVTALEVMTPMFVLVVVNALALALWTFVSPAEWVREASEYDAFERPSESMGYCFYDESLPYLVVLSVTNIGSLVYACYEAYLARDASTEYAESEFIFKSMASVLLFGFVGIPIAILTRENATAYNCVLAGIAYSVSLSFQLYIFVPKIKYHRNAEKEAKESPRLPIRRKGNVFVTRRFSKGDSARVSVEVEEGTTPSEGDFGVRVYNRRQMQEDLEAENKRLRDENQCLLSRIATLEGGTEEGGKRSPGILCTTRSVSIDSMNDRQSRPESIVVSEAESKITLDPQEHPDESFLEVAPF